MTDDTRVASDDHHRVAPTPPPEPQLPVVDLLAVVFIPVGAVLVPWVWVALRPDLPASPVFVILAELILLYLAIRQLSKYVRRRLAKAKAKAKQRWPSRHVSKDELELLNAQLKEQLSQSRLDAQQLELFAISLAQPAALRRRLTDRYTVQHRVLDRTVSIEFDLDLSLHPDSRSVRSSSARGRNDVPAIADELHDRPKYVAALLLRKGRLHDNSRLVDSQGRAVSALSYKEYRLLAGLTLRSLLIAAFDGHDKVTNGAWRAESKYMELLLQFGIVTEGPDTTASRVDKVVKTVKSFRKRLDDRGKEYLDLLISFLQFIATGYAVVAVLPPDTSHRFFLTYEATEIPEMRAPSKSARARLRRLLGARPLSLNLSAANAATCQSYHLLAGAPENLYLADFDTPFIRQDEDGQVPSDSQVSYHRVRSRRGQHYFHLYSRPGPDLDPKLLHVTLRFLEVPPGSIGRAAISALAALVGVFFVAWASVSQVELESGAIGSSVDGNVAVFLLALPGLAAVWIGFEASQSRFVEIPLTITSLVSLSCTFITSLAATILVLFQKTGALPPVAPFGDYVPHPLWMLILAIAALNAAVSSGILLERMTYYRVLTGRPIAGTSFVYYD